MTAATRRFEWYNFCPPPGFCPDLDHRTPPSMRADDCGGTRPKSLVSFLGVDKESAFAAYMKVAQRHKAVQMSQLPETGDQVRIFSLKLNLLT